MDEDRFVNKAKLERAQVEARISGEDIEAIYVRMGGKIKDDAQVEVVVPDEPKPKKKAAKKK